MTTKYSSQAKRWSTAGLALIALLTSMAMIAGCAASPYDLVEQDAATISADVRQAIDKLITDANDIASAQDGKVYVDVKEFAREIFFVPAPGIPFSILRSHTVPKNAVLKEWTDRFALAQELSHRYSYVETLEIDRQIHPPYFTAKVKVLLKASHRWAYAGKPKGIPTAPDGYVAWSYHGPRMGMYGTGGCSGRLPAPTTPAGKMITPSLPIDAISKSALDSLGQSPPKESEHVVVANMAYDHLKKCWYLKYVTRKSFPRPEWLHWRHGLGEDKYGYVLSPGEIRRRKSNRKPAPKE